MERRYQFCILSAIDEACRECLALPVTRRLRNEDVLAVLAELSVTRGPPAHIRSDNGPEFIANAVQESWKGLARHSGAPTAG
jgi:putative transposase